MTLHARDVMVTNFDTIHVDAPVKEAIDKIANGVVRDTGYKTISLMVVDDMNRLCGVVTMFDILYHLRPDCPNFGIDGTEMEWEGQLNNLVQKFQGKTVRQVMTHNIVSANMDDHIMILLDRMVKNKYRRLPVLKNNTPFGIVYISDVFHRVFSQKTI